MYYVYVIRSEKGKIYIGQTENIDIRLKQHNDKNFDKRSYTKLQGSYWKLVYFEEYQTRKEVYIREKNLKSHKGRDWLKSLLGE